MRLGYFSPDFRNHAVAYLTAELFETHDRDRFEVIAFSFGPEGEDEMRRRMRAAFDRFHDVGGLGDREVAALSRELRIDIAIDLAGHTQHSRTGIFAFRAAPIQVVYAGYLGTLGAPYMDYAIADPTIVPPASREFHAEKIAYLPAYQANDSRRAIASRRLERDELGLPQAGFVFCCFNGSYKIVPATFDRWMRILRQVAHSVLLLYVGSDAARSNLMEEAKRRGVDPSRLVFADALPREEYLARFRSADLFLDTLPYNAGTVASDALWAGLPVLTLMGESLASRIAASVLDAIGLPELVTRSPGEYEARAIELATNPAKLAELKARLERNRATTPLFDTRSFTRNLEAAYLEMYERHLTGLPPDHIPVMGRDAA